MLIGWGVFGIFIVCGLLEGNDLVRIDIGYEVIVDVNWFYFLYLGIEKFYFNKGVRNYFLSII